MEKEEFYGVTDKDLYNFVEACLSQEDGFLHISTTALADTFVLLCKKFKGASILDFAYTTENKSARIMYKRKNDFYLHLGLHVFLPDLRFGETYAYDVTLLFRDISEITYNPISLNENTEIEIDCFTANSDECVFSCHSKDDKEKKFSIKAKELLVENYISPEDDEDEETSENIFESEANDSDNYSSKTKESVKPLSALELALQRFKEKNYNDCIHILKYQYKDLDKDAEANNYLSLCYCYLNNVNEAILYINKAIELDDSRCNYFDNKGYYLCKLGLYKEAINNFKQAIKIAPDEKHTRQITRDIIDLVNIATKYYNPVDLVDSEKFEEFITYFDSILNLQYCFPEYKEKFKEVKEEAVLYFYQRTKSIYENQFHTKSYQNIADRCKAVLNVSNLSPEIEAESRRIYEECLNILQKETKKIKFIEDLYKKGYSVDEIVESFNAQFDYKIYDYEVKSQIEKIKVKRGIDVPLNPLPSPRDKLSAISEMMDEGYTKSEMIEQLSADFGISEDSAEATINSYYKDDDLQLGNYFDNLLEDDED